MTWDLFVSLFVGFWQLVFVVVYVLISWLWPVAVFLAILYFCGCIIAAIDGAVAQAREEREKRMRQISREEMRDR